MHLPCPSVSGLPLLSPHYRRCEIAPAIRDLGRDLRTGSIGPHQAPGVPTLSRSALMHRGCCCCAAGRCGCCAVDRGAGWGGRAPRGDTAGVCGSARDRTTNWIHFRHPRRPLDPTNAKRYAYASADSISPIDPMGHEVDYGEACAIGVVGGFVTGVISGSPGGLPGVAVGAATGVAGGCAGGVATKYATDQAEKD